MIFDIQFGSPWILFSLVPVIALFFWYKVTFQKQVTYQFPLAGYLKKNAQGIDKKWFLYGSALLQSLILLLLACALAHPRIVDVKSKINVEGIDIMLVLDVSGSMQICDDPQDQRSRLDVAKQEAIKFIEKRENDPLGLVIFAHDSVSRCPLTLDKKILKEIMHDTKIGIIDPSGTVLSLGIIMAANRLKNSKASNKIMIVLTDGTPSADDVPAEQAIAVAKKLGIKIYTIGIGYDGIRYFNDPFNGPQAIPGVNKELLLAIAQQTGGRYFEAKKPHDMKKIYETIDRFEKTEYQTDIFTRYYDLFHYFIMCAFIIILIELLVLHVWFIV